MELKFDTDYKIILEKMDQIEPAKYGSTRNYVEGAVTYLSPYISRGVISTKQVLEFVLNKGYNVSQIGSFVRELGWRDYFQRVAQVKDLNTPIKHLQRPILNYEISTQIVEAATGIEGIDVAIKKLYETGYMHNHCRMYTASLACNIANSHWYHPAQWLYYHLLDGDWPSNACSWQWVAGANSHKKYYANQENINKYTYTKQVNTYLDKPYEVLETMDAPASLLATQKVNFPVELPKTPDLKFNPILPTFLYNYYNLDPLWHKGEPGNRILLIEPDFFTTYPVSKNCMNFMLALSTNIPDIQVYIDSFQSFVKDYKPGNIYYKEHPLNAGYNGNEEARDWITEEVWGYYPSFFSYWKKVEKILYK